MKGTSALIKKQLIVFTTAGVIGAFFLAATFMRVPEELGIGRHIVSVEFAQGAGLYDGAEVVYLGHPVGRVESMSLAGDRLVAELKLKDDVPVPATVTAEIHSRSAVGEQYVSLVPIDSETTPVLADGDRIPMERTSYPVEIGPVLDNVQALVSSIDEEQLSSLIDEAGTAFDGRAGDLQAILDSGASFIDVADANFGPTADLLRDAGPVLSTINGEGEGIARLTTSLAQVTEELRAGDGDLRKLLEDGPGFATETAGFIDDLAASLPALLNNTNPVLATLRVYNAHLEQLLTDYPLALATVQSVTIPNEATNEIRLTVANVDKPPECVSGFVPAAQWSSPFDATQRKTPLVFCDLPSSDPRGVRGARNLPCPTEPGRREADVAQC